jgi:hypothetical protein
MTPAERSEASCPTRGRGLPRCRLEACKATLHFEPISGSEFGPNSSFLSYWTKTSMQLESDGLRTAQTDYRDGVLARRDGPSGLPRRHTLARRDAHIGPLPRPTTRSCRRAHECCRGTALRAGGGPPGASPESCSAHTENPYATETPEPQGWATTAAEAARTQPRRRLRIAEVPPGDDSLARRHRRRDRETENRS